MLLGDLAKRHYMLHEKQLANIRETLRKGKNPSEQGLMMSYRARLTLKLSLI